MYEGKTILVIGGGLPSVTMEMAERFVKEFGKDMYVVLSPEEALQLDGVTIPQKEDILTLKNYRLPEDIGYCADPSHFIRPGKRKDQRLPSRY
jgi:hypothetical protein